MYRSVAYDDNYEPSIYFSFIKMIFQIKLEHDKSCRSSNRMVRNMILNWLEISVPGLRRLAIGMFIADVCCKATGYGEIGNLNNEYASMNLL